MTNTDSTGTLRPIQHALAACYDDAFMKAVPWVPLGPVDVDRLREHIAPATALTIVPLYPGRKSVYLQWSALWMVLNLRGGEYEETSDEVRFAAASMIYRGSPQCVCEWLLKNGLPTPADDVDVVRGVNTQHIKSKHGVVIGARNGAAEVEFGGLAKTFMGKAIVGPFGVAVTNCGEAIAGNKAVAVSQGWGSAAAGEGGLAVTLDEFCNATVADHGVAVAGFGGMAITGPGGVAIARSGTVQGGAAAVLIVLTQDRIAIARVGEGGIEPDTAYHLSDGRFIKGEWAMDGNTGEQVTGDPPGTV
jgi:hypothetical protein